MKSQTDETILKNASNAALASILNLTLLPVISFIALLLIYKKTKSGNIDHYHAVLGIKINITAMLVLFVVSALMITFIGFNSPWTWVYVISYFTLVHTIFIMIALWALVRSWSGDELRKRSKS